MTLRLLNCPFCGAALVKSEAFSNRLADCFLHPAADDGYDFCVVHDVRIYSNNPERIAAWNRRAAPARLPDSPSVSQDEPDYKSLFLSVREALERIRERAGNHHIWADAATFKQIEEIASTALSVGGGGGKSSSVARADMTPGGASNRPCKSEGREP